MKRIIFQMTKERLRLYAERHPRFGGFVYRFARQILCLYRSIKARRNTAKADGAVTGAVTTDVIDQIIERQRALRAEVLALGRQNAMLRDTVETLERKVAGLMPPE